MNVLPWIRMSAEEKRAHEAKMAAARAEPPAPPVKDQVKAPEPEPLKVQVMNAIYDGPVVPGHADADGDAPQVDVPSRDDRRAQRRR